MRHPLAMAPVWLSEDHLQESVLNLRIEPSYSTSASAFASSESACPPFVKLLATKK